MRDLPELSPQLYAQWRASQLGAMTERLERRLLHAHIGPAGGKPVLEVGCGDGALAVELAEMGARVSAIDTSEIMIDAASSSQVPSRKYRFRRAPADELPFENEGFDIVVGSPICVSCPRRRMPCVKSRAS